MVSTPHSVRQLRSGRMKSPEVYTGAIGEILHSMTGCHLISKTGFQYDDANFDKNCKYKISLKEHIMNRNIKIFVDIHGLFADNKYALDLCINGYQNIRGFEQMPNLITNICEVYNVRPIGVDSVFRADRPSCVSNYVSNTCNIPAIEIEINKAYRNPCEDFEGFKTMVVVLCESIEQMLSSANKLI